MKNVLSSLVASRMYEVHTNECNYRWGSYVWTLKTNIYSKLTKGTRSFTKCFRLDLKIVVPKKSNVNLSPFCVKTTCKTIKTDKRIFIRFHEKGCLFEIKESKLALTSMRIIYNNHTFIMIWMHYVAFVQYAWKPFTTLPSFFVTLCVNQL
jgi:hypothetical protein